MEQLALVENEFSETTDREFFLSLARNAFDESETVLDSGHKTRWRRNYSLAQSEHPDDSKYLSDPFKHRSKTFRGKTESSVRKNEAALAVALFSNRDVVSITAENQGDERQDEVSDAIHQVVNYRLDTAIKWFLTGIGAYHEAMIAGDVVSEQYWDYSKDKNGEVLIDKPTIDLHPLEHVHISPHSDWRDPINSSPYLIIEELMFVGDIKERMDIDWIEYSDSQIQTAITSYKHNSVEQSRLGDDQTGAKEQVSSVADFDAVYVHKVMIRHEGEELFYYTLGETLLLSDPIPLREAYPHIKDDKRPFVWGTATVEPHKVYRRSLVDRVAGAQFQSNDISNQRFDNVRQVLNKRKFVKRGMGVDYSNLLNNVPGGIVLMDELDAVKPEETGDVTGSSYQEQNMINVDFDELAGSFSNASVATNRSLNETVGGMQLLQGNSNTMTEYQLRVFVESWVEPVIRQVVSLIQFYEDDEVIQQVTGEEFTHEDLQIPLSVRVSVGFGSTDPQQKIQKLVYGIQAIQAINPEKSNRLKTDKIIEEVFSALGYNDASSFFEDEEEEQDPRIAELMQQLQQLQQVIQTDQHKIETKGQVDMQLKQLEGQIDMQLEQVKGQTDFQIEQGKAGNKTNDLILSLQAERQIKLTQMALDRGIKVKELAQKAGVDSGKNSLEHLKAMNKRMETENKVRELNFKMRTGKQGI